MCMSENEISTNLGVEANQLIAHDNSKIYEQLLAKKKKQNNIPNTRGYCKVCPA